MLLIQGSDGAFYGDVCVYLPDRRGGNIVFGDDGPTITIPTIRARSPLGAAKVMRRWFREFGIEGELLPATKYPGSGWIAGFQLRNWIDPTRFEYSCRCGVPPIETPFIGFRFEFAKRTIINVIQGEFHHFLAKWLLPGPAYIRRSDADKAHLITVVSGMLPRFKATPEYLEKLPNPVVLDTRPRRKRAVPKETDSNRSNAVPETVHR